MYYPIKPRGNRKIINNYIHHPSFRDEDIDNIITMLDEKKWTEAGVVTGESGPYKSDIRTNSEQVIPPDKTGFPYTQLANIIAELNRDWWNFDVTGFNFTTDHPAIFQYKKTQKFDWHFDVTNIEPTRKLGFTLQLSDSNDYEGGQLEFFGYDYDKATRKRGTLILFPTYTWHRVTPVTKGRRLAMVGWVHGPSFQ